MFCNLVFQQHLQPVCLVQFLKKPPSACTHLTILSNQLSMTPAHVDWGMLKMTPSMNAGARIFNVLKLLSLQLPFDGREHKPVTGG